MATNNWMTPLGGTTTGGPTQPPDVLWEPSQLSSLVTWYDADSITGLSNGDTVSSWTDRAGNFDLSTGSTPTFNTNGINNKPVVQFNAAAMTAGVAADFKFLHTAAYSVAGVFQVGYPGATQSGNGYVITTTTSTGQIGCEYRFNASNNRFIASHLVGSNVQSAQVIDGTVSQNQPLLFAAVGDAASSTVSQRMELFSDGTSVGTNSKTSTPSTSDPTNALIVGSMIGYVAELVVCDAEVTSDDRQKLEGYLAHKWGLTANLPTNHPYKSSPPVWAQISGGTETFADGYKYSTFTSGSTLTASTGGVVEYCIVGGGGGGAASMSGGGGGGGGGGFLSGTTTVTSQSYTITVGDGGAGSPAATIADGVSGGDSAAFGLTAIGGGGGGFFRGGGGGVGLTGGSGGGAGGNMDGTRAGGTGTAGQGNDGSTGFSTYQYPLQSGGGGGGGAGSAGSISTTSVGGAGGAGAEWPAGSGNYYAAGGQAGHGNGSTTVVSGAANTGNGGAGSEWTVSGGGSGGSGVVIVRSKVWAQASGGTETTSGGYKYHTFTASGTLTVSSAGNVEYLVVGGGGGGGTINRSGGGGAGGALTGTFAASATSYSITIGAGGGANTNGSDSSAFSLTAIGGGKGATSIFAGSSGGSGGGGGSRGVGGSGTAGQGNDGGDGGGIVSNEYNSGAGGGGGAGAAGGDGVSAGDGGDGGAGIEWPSGSGTYYAGGGGGSSYYGNGGNGGSGGGGGAASREGTDGSGGSNGGSAASGNNGGDGGANTGGGGGGGILNSGTSGSGGSGIVIVRYKV